MSVTPNVSLGDGLTPLPNTFDPDAISSAAASATSEHNNHANGFVAVDGGQSASPPSLAPFKNDDLESISAEETIQAVTESGRKATETVHDEEEGIINVAPISPRTTNDGRVELGEEVAETEEDRPEINPALFGFLKSIQDTGEDEAEDKGEAGEREAALSSPLSDLPDLPSELPPSPDPPTPPPLPESAVSSENPAAAKPPTMDPLAPVMAESSATAARRASSSSKTPMATASASASKAPIKRQLESSEADTENADKESALDDLESLDGEARAGPSHRDKTNPQLDVETDSRPEIKSAEIENGRPARAAKRRKIVDPLGSPSSDTAEQKDKNTRAPRTMIMNDVQLKSHLKGRTREVQLAPCLRPRYARWGKCTQCVSKIGGDSCRFRDYRIFRIDPETAEIMGPGMFESTAWKDKITPLPMEFNVPFTEEHMKRIERTVSPMLLPLITRELRHVVRNEAIQRGTDAARHRAVCDFCSSTIFGGWFFCKKCGRDYCLVCERYFSDSDEKMGQSPWHLPDAARPRLLRCTPNNGGPDEVKQESGRQKRGTCFHFRPDLQPVSRFSEDELRQHWISLAEFVLHSEGSVGDRLKLLGLSGADDETVSQMQDWLAKLSYSQRTASPVITDEEVRKLYTKRTHPIATVADPAEMEDRSQAFMFVDNKELTLEVFDQLWSKGEPIVVDKVGDELKMSWTPDDFIQRFGKELCVIIDCQTNEPTPKTVEAFFEIFKDPENRSDKVLKLKDWPQTNDFADTHPELYNDFCDALPVPDFTRREGVLNLYAHFPPGPTRPDIGPKMYNAFAAKETPGGQGSTRLHMDVADAVNVMLYASDRPDGQPGCAVWDLFRAEDADKIRSYLKRKFDKTHKFTDPIHSQLFYLDSNKRKELAERYGVVSWRVYQYPGQAVFIPAGCAHQVCNLADCIKIALDFVSPHNVTRCQQLTQDFRTENFVKAWKEDVLQLYNVLWYAWTNVGETRQRRIQEEKTKEEEARRRKAHLESLAKGASGFPDRPRVGLLSAAVSSMRDEENTRSSPAPMPSATSSPSRRDTNTPVPTASPKNDTLHGEDNDTTNTGSTDKVKSSTHVFAEKLLTASLLASESAPPPEARVPSAATKWGGALRPLSSGASSSLAKPKKPVIPPMVRGRRGAPLPVRAATPPRVKTSQLIKMGALPIDIAVSAARLQMGEGADDEMIDGMEITTLSEAQESMKESGTKEERETKSAEKTEDAGQEVLEEVAEEEETVEEVKETGSEKAGNEEMGPDVLPAAGLSADSVSADENADEREDREATIGLEEEQLVRTEKSLAVVEEEGNMDVDEAVGRVLIGGRGLVSTRCM